MRLLLIEDEVKAAEQIKLGLTQSEYSVDIAHDGQVGLTLAQAQPYDLIILDIMLPGLDGFSVLKLLREHNQSVPVLLLTARDAIEDRVLGLNLGADDYLVKPFAFSELLARVQALLRRGAKPVMNVIKVADLEIDLFNRKVKKAGERIDLTPKEFALLALLIKHQGHTLSRMTIAEQVWDIHFASDSNVIDVAVKRLRQKIGDSTERRLIHSVRGRGYVFEDREQGQGE